MELLENPVRPYSWGSRTVIADLLGACRGLGVDRVSLNFAVFRSALERGEKIGAGPVARLWARVLRTALAVDPRWQNRIPSTKGSLGG